MGQMADLNLAACREENGRLRQALVQAQGMIQAMRSIDRVGQIEQRFIAAALTGMMIDAKKGTLYTALASEAITAGRTTARLYIEQLAAESEEEKPEGAGGDKDNASSAGEH